MGARIYEFSRKSRVDVFTTSFDVLARKILALGCVDTFGADNNQTSIKRVVDFK